MSATPSKRHQRPLGANLRAAAFVVCGVVVGLAGHVFFPSHCLPAHDLKGSDTTGLTRDSTVDCLCQDHSASLQQQAKQGCPKCPECSTTTATIQQPMIDQIDVDAVIPWVNGTEENWRQRYIAVFGATSLRDLHERFVEHGEIYLAIASVQAFAPWIRKIFIVTASQKLDVSLFTEGLQLKIHIVDHKDIFPATALPTFSSVAITSRVYKIPGLADHFIFMNDDIPFLRPLNKSTVFDETGKFKLFAESISPDWLFAPLTEKNEFQIASRNSAVLIRRKYRAVSLTAWHGGQFMTKRSCEEAWKFFFPDLNRTLHHRYRSTEALPEGDVIFSYLARSVALLSRYQTLDESRQVVMIEEYSDTYKNTTENYMFLALQYVARYTGPQKVEMCRYFMNSVQHTVKATHQKCFCTEQGFGIGCLE